MLALLLLALSLGIEPPAAGPASDPIAERTATAAPATVPVSDPRPLRLRTADPQAAELLAEGLRGSPLFRQLAEAVEAADLLVFVETHPQLVSAGSVVFVGLAGDTRILRVRIRKPGNLRALVAALGHELQHVVEIGEALEVRSEQDLARHYESIGVSLEGGHHDHVRRFETTAARSVELEILKQLRERPAVRP